ncbi:hypothetical protein AAF712_010729 [Marasmius tenuissimus]|uniref:Uncharacterized protein n=1 Tax=Marasmius tenuissimus TaxID=585030 RepID=A0ABR2ZM09_9AGAR
MVLSFFTKKYKKKRNANEIINIDEGENEDDLATVIDKDAAVEAQTTSLAMLRNDRTEGKSMKERAIWEMESEGVRISDSEKKDAQHIIPKVAGLSK